MSKPSTAARNKWNAANYDSYRVQLPKGQREQLKAICQKNGVSMNSVFTQAAAEYIEKYSTKEL